MTARAESDRRAYDVRIHATNACGTGGFSDAIAVVVREKVRSIRAHDGLTDQEH